MLPLVFTTFMQYLKRRFATTNRWNISICHKILASSGNGQPCENTPLSYFDYREKCDCCFSYYVCVCRSQKFGGCWSPSWNGTVALSMPDPL